MGWRAYRGSAIEKGRPVWSRQISDMPQGFNIALNSYWMDRDTYDVEFYV